MCGTPINLCGTPRSKHSFIAYFLYDKFLHLNIIKYTKIDLQIALIGLLLVDTSWFSGCTKDDNHGDIGTEVILSMIVNARKVFGSNWARVFCLQSSKLCPYRTDQDSRA